MFQFCIKAPSIFLYCMITICFPVIQCFILESALVTGIGYAAYHFRCSFRECCDDEYIPYNTNKLRWSMESKLYGQPLAMKIVDIILAHKNSIKNKRSNKALAISLHGWPGTGKNYVAQMMVDALYKNPKTTFVKWYHGQHSFSSIYPNNEHAMKLVLEITAIVERCPKALIIFDEVNDIPSGVLDAIKPMLDYHSSVGGVDFSEAIFLFLSNLNGNEITDKFIALNKPRNELELSDFEEIIRKGSFYETGGLQQSRLIISHLIDHYIPFLPLEQTHVEMCIRDEFAFWGKHNVNQDAVDQVMKVITFGPKHKPLFSNSGCKRIKKEVAFYTHHQ